MKKTAYFVLAFIVILILAGYSAKSSAEEGYGTLGLGTTLINSELKTAELGYNYKGWEVQGTLIERGSTKKGPQDYVKVVSVSHLVEPSWGYKGVEPYFRLGLSYNPESNLVGNTNFKLGIGVDFNEVFRLEYTHHSSAGIHETNTGIDYVTIVYRLPNPW
jgi:hypothetical protein